MNKRYSLIFFVILQCMTATRSYGQFLTENASDRKDMTAAVDFYYKSLGDRAGLYNGVEYTGYGRVLKEGHQFFESTEKSLGAVFYDGMIYKDVPLWYDIIKDQLVAEYADGFSKLVLHKDKIKFFNIHGHAFINYLKDSTIESSPPSGYYDQIYKGKIEVLVKRSKAYTEIVSREGIWFNVSKQRDERYLKKDGEYWHITGVKSALKALGSKQNEIQDYLKKNKIKFKRDPEKAIKMMAGYYEQINTN